MLRTVQVGNLEIGAGRPKIVAPIVGRTTADILQAAKKIVTSQTDLVEWRLDYFQNAGETTEVLATLAALRSALSSLPLLFTFRTIEQGGCKAISGDNYRQINTLAAESGLVELIDVELQSEDYNAASLIQTIQSTGVKVVASYHNFEETPSETKMIQELRSMLLSPADILKYAVIPSSLQDVLALLSATSQMQELYVDRPLVTIAMAELGLVSRLCGEVFGSALTFGTVDGISAPGQIPVEQLATVLAIIHKHQSGSQYNI